MEEETEFLTRRKPGVFGNPSFEYYISSSSQGSLNRLLVGLCLPGCFCMYDQRHQRGSDGYWVPILANPDIVEERYSDNVVLILCVKNLVLGEKI